MKKTVLFSLLAMAFAVSPANASRVDVTGVGGFGGLVASFDDTTTICTGCGLFPYTLTIEADAYYDGSVYTYVYAISSAGNVGPVDIVTIESSAFPDTATLSLPGFDFGVIHALAPAIDPRLLTVLSNGNLSFLFTLGITPTSPITVYVQADRPPTLVPFFGQDGGQASGAITLAPRATVPESGSTMAFLGLALIVMAAGRKFMV